MSDDFPAAHSMDSSWFAVDRDGHVTYSCTDFLGWRRGDRRGRV